jgi:hypothetical protein
MLVEKCGTQVFRITWRGDISIRDNFVEGYSERR